MIVAPRQPSTWVVGVVIAVSSFCLASLLGLSSWGQLLELKSYDAAATWSGSRSDSKAVVIYIDDYSKRQIPDPLVFWHRYYGDVLQGVAKAGAKGIGVDLIFGLNSANLPPGFDQGLTKSYLGSVSAGTPVVMGFDRTTALPDSRIYMAARANDLLGYLDLFPDPDDFIRRFQPCASVDGEVLASLGIQVAARSQMTPVTCTPGAVRIGASEFQRDPAGHTMIRYLGPEYTVPHVSFADVLKLLKEGDTQKMADLFHGKLVFIGMDDSQDRHATAFYSTLQGKRRTPGVEIHASIALMVMNNAGVRVPSSLASSVFSLLLIAVAIGLALRLRWYFSAVTGVLLALAAFGTSAALYTNGLWLSPTTGQMGILIGYMGVSAYRYRTEYRGRMQLRRHFAHYVSDEVIEEILSHGQVELGGTRQQITVLFSDIRGFTTLSEQLSPEVLVKQLNEYLSAMTDVVMDNGGMVDKFIGDGILALYGAPLEKRDASWRAVSSAIKMTEQLARLNARWEAEGRHTLQIGIGIHTGDAIVGNIGSPRKMDYTAVGDTVNTASRVESQTKDSIQRYGAPIIITDATLRDLERWDHRVDAEAIGIETLKGKTGLTKLYILRGLQKE